MSLWRILISSDSLIEEARHDAVEMLQMGKRMFERVLHMMLDPRSENAWERMAAHDRKLNGLQREVRKKVYEHIVISRGKDLILGLQLTNIVVDLERIGDYTKNFAELADLFPEGMNWPRYQGPFDEVHERTLVMFDRTREAFEGSDERLAREALALYDAQSKACDGVVGDLLEDGASSDRVQRSYLALVLSMRYLKRVNAHLKNVATTVVNPFHETGFRPGAL